METVTVTTKGQITIPAELRRKLEITGGTKLIVLSQLAGIDKEVFKERKPSEELVKMRKEWTQEFEQRLKEA